VPPVLACFTDQDARVRYYACESMYNIAKVAKGEVLPYFNDIFDALCKVSSLPRSHLLIILLIFGGLAWSRFRTLSEEWGRAAGPSD
jgi:Vacuolar 14 Fab1-binding region